MRLGMLPFLLALTALAGAGCGAPGTAPEWAEPRVAEPPTPAWSGQPGLSASGDRVLLSWVESPPNGVPTLSFSILRDGRWSDPREVFRSADLLVNYAEIPAVVSLADGTLAAMWAERRAGADDAAEIRLAVSRDGGVTWSASAVPHRNDAAVPRGLASLAPDGACLAAAWLDGRAGDESEYGGGGTRLYWARWDGAGFEPEELVDDRVCDCCKTAVARTASGWLIAYRDRSDRDLRDIGIAVRRGAVWSSPRPLARDGWRLSACPTNGPAAAAAGDTAVVAWFTGAEGRPRVLAAFSRNGGADFGPPILLSRTAVLGRVDAALYPDGSAAVVWLENRGSGAAAVVARRVAPGGRAGPPVELAVTAAGHASGFPRALVRSADEILITWTETKPRPRVRLTAARLPL